MRRVLVRAEYRQVVYAWINDANDDAIEVIPEAIRDQIATHDEEFNGWDNCKPLTRAMYEKDRAELDEGWSVNEYIPYGEPPPKMKDLTLGEIMARREKMKRTP